MATENILFSETVEASGDLSSYQWHAVKYASDGQAELAGAGEAAIGILQNDPDAEGEEAEVGMIGISKAVVDGNSVNIAKLDPLKVNASGHLCKADTDKDIFIAQALEASTADGDVIRVRLLGYSTLSTS